MSTVATRTLRVELLAPHKAQRQIRAEAKRFNVLACGRRFGKTALALELVVESLLAGHPVAWYSPTYKFLADAWRQVKEICAEIVATKSEAEHRLAVVTGGRLEMWSLDDPDAGRGRSYARVVIDEAALVRDLERAWTAAIRPTLTDLGGDAWIMSTPRGRNYFLRLWERGASGEPGWAAWKFPTSANPYIDPAEIEEARHQLPERIFAQEFLAEFLADSGGGVFRRVREAATATPQERAIEGHRYVMGADWGKYQGFTVLTVIDSTARAVAAIDRFGRVDYHVQVGRVQALFERFRPDAIVAERNAMGEPIIEQLQRLGLPVMPFTATNASKALIIDALALALERGELALLPDETLLAELDAFDAIRLPGGLLRYAAPNGMHDDTVISLALAHWGATGAARVELAPSLWE